MAIGSVTIDITGQLTNAKEILDELQKSLGKVDLNTSFGKQFKSMVDQATSMYNKSARNAQRRVNSEVGIEKVSNEINNLFDVLNNTSKLLTSIKPLDLNMSTASLEVQNLYADLQKAKQELDSLQSKNNFSNLIAESKDLQEAFQKIGLNVANMTKEQVGKALASEYEKVTKQVKNADAEVQKYKQTLDAAQTAVESLNNKKNTITSNANYNTALATINQGQAQQLTGKEQIFSPDAFNTMINSMRNMLQTMVPELQKSKLDEIFKIDSSSIKTLEDAQLALTGIRQNLLELQKTKVQNITKSLNAKQVKELEQILSGGLNGGAEGNYTKTGARAAIVKARKYLGDQGFNQDAIKEIIPTNKALEPFLQKIDSARVKFSDLITIAKQFSQVIKQTAGTENAVGVKQVDMLFNNPSTNKAYKAQDLFIQDPRVQQQFDAFANAAQTYKDSGIFAANNNYTAQLDAFIKNINGKTISLQQAFEGLQAIIRNGETVIAEQTAKTGIADANYQRAQENAIQVHAQAQPVAEAQTKYNDFITSLETRISDLEKDVSNYKSQIENLLKSSVTNLQNTGATNSEKANLALNESVQLGEKYNQQLDRAKEKQQFIGKLEGVVQRWFSIYTVIRMVSKAINEVRTTLKELDKTITEIAIVTDMTQKDLWNQMSNYTAMARQYGASISGVYKVSQLYYQQGGLNI